MQKWSILNVAPAWHRAYVRSHWVGLSVAVGIFLSGLLSLVSPETVEQSAPVVVLPPWVVVLLNVNWTVGGALTSVGLVRGWLHLHGPGMTLIGGGLVAYYVAIASLRPEAALAVLFIPILGGGCILHALFLGLYGYSGTETRLRR